MVIGDYSLSFGLYGYIHLFQSYSLRVIYLFVKKKSNLFIYFGYKE